MRHTVKKVRKADGGLQILGDQASDDLKNPNLKYNAFGQTGANNNKANTGANNGNNANAGNGTANAGSNNTGTTDNARMVNGTLVAGGAQPSFDIDDIHSEGDSSNAPGSQAGNAGAGNAGAGNTGGNQYTNDNIILGMGNIQNARNAIELTKYGKDFFNWYGNKYGKYTSAYGDLNNLHTAWQQYNKEKGITDFWEGRDMTKIDYNSPGQFKFDDATTEKNLNDLRKKYFNNNIFARAFGKTLTGDAKKLNATVEAAFAQAKQNAINNGFDPNEITIDDLQLDDETKRGWHILHGDTKLSQANFKGWDGKVTDINDEFGHDKAKAMVDHEARMAAWRNQFNLPANTDNGAQPGAAEKTYSYNKFGNNYYDAAHEAIFNQLNDDQKQKLSVLAGDDDGVFDQNDVRALLTKYNEWAKANGQKLLTVDGKLGTKTLTALSSWDNELGNQIFKNDMYAYPGTVRQDSKKKEVTAAGGGNHSASPSRNSHSSSRNSHSSSRNSHSSSRNSHSSSRNSNSSSRNSNSPSNSTTKSSEQQHGVTSPLATVTAKAPLKKDNTISQGQYTRRINTKEGKSVYVDKNGRDIYGNVWDLHFWNYYHHKTYDAQQAAREKAWAEQGYGNFSGTWAKRSGKYTSDGKHEIYIGTDGTKYRLMGTKHLIKI